MTTKPLILMACSGNKLDRPAQAQEIYQGVMWQSLRANAPAGQMPHLVILSAKYGFLSGSTVIEPYNNLLSESRSRELEYDLEQYMKTVDWPKDATRILLAGGGHYRYLMRRMVGALISVGKLSSQLQISEVSGPIGIQRSQLGRFARDPSSLPVEYVGYHPNGTPLLGQAWGLAVGDRVRTIYDGRAELRFARVEELFIGPGGPTASVEFEDNRPPLASGKSRQPSFARGAWVEVTKLERIPPPKQALSEHLAFEGVWEPIPGLQALAERGVGNWVPPMSGSEFEEREVAASPRH